MADALASGASVRKDVGVQVPPRAPFKTSRLIPSRADYRVFELLDRELQLPLRLVEFHFRL